MGDAPANINAAVTWLQHCHRFDLSEAVPVSSSAAETCLTEPEYAVCISRYVSDGALVAAVSQSSSARKC